MNCEIKVGELAGFLFLEVICLIEGRVAISSLLEGRESRGVWICDNGPVSQRLDIVRVPRAWREDCTSRPPADYA